MSWRASFTLIATSHPRTRPGSRTVGSLRQAIPRRLGRLPGQVDIAGDDVGDPDEVVVVEGDESRERGGVTRRGGLDRLWEPLGVDRATHARNDDAAGRTVAHDLANRGAATIATMEIMGIRIPTVVQDNVARRCDGCLEVIDGTPWRINIFTLIASSGRAGMMTIFQWPAWPSWKARPRG